MNPQKYSPKEYLGHREVVILLADLRGFSVKKDNLLPFTFAHVGMAYTGKLAYIDYLIGPGDSYVVTFMRPANKKERNFYFK